MLSLIFFNDIQQDDNTQLNTVPYRLTRLRKTTTLSILINLLKFIALVESQTTHGA